MKIKQPNTCLV